MSLESGARIGVYEVLCALGAGGMGEVYRGHDTALGRDVAIKIIPDAFAADAERLARFEREARVLASLNHPNIAAIYGLERTATITCLVMELAIGDTLAARIGRTAGPRAEGSGLPIDEALPIALQIAAALEAAHEKGIVHRDLKPANIVVSPDGEVKVLDFGLAKLADQREEATYDLTHSPTLAHAGTLAGVILGTAAYMSPEQARGKPVDKRADIWAFGCVVFEMLTGKQVFAGETLTDIVAAVVKNEPDWKALPHETPRRLRDLLERCLQKDPRQRMHDAADVRIAIEDVAKPDAQNAVAAPARRSFPVAAIAAGVILTAILTSAFWWMRARSTTNPPIPLHLSVQLDVKAPAKTDFPFSADFGLSPDGRWIVYRSEGNGARGLFLRNMQELAGKFISGTEGASIPFFSPDGRWIAFSSGKTLKKVSITGGSPVAICDLPTSGFAAGAWGPDNRIAFVPAFNAGIWIVSGDGGRPELLLKTDEAKDWIAYNELQWLPDGKGILFAVSLGRATTSDDRQFAILEPGATEPHLLKIRGVNRGRYVPSGHIVYSNHGALLAVPFDLSSLAVTGSPVTVIEGIETTLSFDSSFEVSANGTLVYQPRVSSSTGSRLASVDRKGNLRPITDDHALPADFSLSPDGKQVAARVIAVNDDVWIYEVADGTATRLTFEPGDEVFPQWTPDGRRIAFGTRIGRMFWKAADGTQPREEFPRGEFPRFPSSFSPDGKTLAFVEVHPSTRNDIWLMPLDGDRKAQPFLSTDADEKGPKFSPDGRWLAYMSDETGRDEIWARPIGSSGAKKRISTGGGAWPVWNRNGRELFFVKDDKIAAVSVDADLNRVGQEHIILDAPSFENTQFQEFENKHAYDVMPDGEHFVVLLTPKYPAITHFNVVVNWLQELTSLAPAR